MGEYIAPVTSDANRACAVCDAGCQFCASSSSTCYVCQNNYYLIDDRATCLSTFTCQQCQLSGSGGVITDGCQSRDKYCRTSCPAQFYYTLYTSWNGGSGDTLTTSSKFDYFTNASSMDNTVNGYQSGTTRTSTSSWTSPTPNSNVLYRRLTNICKLCDYRCILCFGPSNFNCTQCVNNYYKWTTASVCESYCPTGQYQLNISTSYPDN